MRIGVDFDRVLFDTDSFNHYLKESVEGLREIESSPYNDHGVYSPEIHAELCVIEVGKIYEAIRNLERFVYSDADILDEIDHEIVLITRGQKNFQEKKIEASGVKEKVDQVVIVEEGSKDLANIDFLIDDRKKEIEEAEIPGFEFDRTQHSLQEAFKEAEKHGA